MKQNNKKSEYHLYYRLLYHTRKQLPLFVLCTLLGGIAVFLIFSSIGVLLRNIIATLQNEMQGNISSMLLYLVGIFFFGLLSSFSQVGFTYIEQKVQHSFRSQMLDRYFHMDETIASFYPVTEVLNRMTTDVSSCTQAIGYYMSVFILQPILSGVCSVVLLCFIDWRIALLCIVCSFMNLLFAQFSLKRLRTLKAHIVEQKSHTSNFMQECVEGAIEIRTFRLHILFRQRLQMQVDSIGKQMEKFYTLQGLRLQLSNFSSDCITIISLLCLGTWLSSIGMIQFSDIMLSLPLSDQICQMIVAFGNFQATIKQTNPHLERVFEIMDLKGEAEPIKTNTTSLSNGISFHNVTFAYGEHTVLQDISFSIKQGEKVAFVGDSGSGKSTIIKILLGLYMPKDGTVEACGQTLGSGSMQEWRNNFSYVSQDISLFHLTVKENIALSSKAMEQNVQEAAKKANADSFIESLDKTYDFMLGENSAGFSGGQLQRIALARCLFRDSPVIVMDEPTSALDPVSEQIVKESIDQLPNDRSVIAVTHRLLLTCNFDRIYVMEQGRIIERGTHEELLQKQGKYRKLWDLQMK